LVCIAQPKDGGGIPGLIRRVTEFSLTGDAARLGDMRYVAARKQDNGKTQVIAIWSEGKFDIAAMFPDEGDAPGTDVQQRAAAERRWLPAPNDRLLDTERQTIKLLLQAPHFFGSDWLGLDPGDFTHRAYAAIFRTMQQVRAAADADVAQADWIHLVRSSVPHEMLAPLVASLAVEPFSVRRSPSEAYAQAEVAKLRLLTAMRQVNELKSRLQRTNPVENATAYNQMFSELVVLEARKASLHSAAQAAHEPD
jgi:DNA primase